MVICAGCGHESPPGQKFCGECGSPLGEASLAPDVRKTVTVLFVDLVGSTSLGESNDPERVRKIMSRYFDAVRVVLERHGASVEKFIGDAVMAVFGIPVLREDDALRAVRAAAEIPEAVERLAAESQVGLQVRVGLNTGEVVAGDPAARQNLVTGDAVNVAARLQQAAAPGEIIVGQTTYDLVHHAVEVTALEAQELKGRTGRVGAYRLTAVGPAAVSHPRRARAPMVGRKRQRRQIAQAFEAVVEDSDCQLFTILGTPGVGKSRLVDEFVAEFDSQMVVGVGRCLPYGDGITYWPLVEAIRSLAGVSEADISEQAAGRLERLIEPLSDHARRSIAALLGFADHTVGVDDISVAARQLFDRVAAERPAVLIFDDIHWAEPRFLDLIEHLADASRGVPLLLVCMARPELLDMRPAWGGGKTNSTTVLLEPLDRDAADELISHVLGGDLDEDIKRKVMDAAEGNPLFVEEMVSMLLDDDLLVPGRGKWKMRASEEVKVPASLQLLLAARVDGLEREERTTISRAAVVGKAFEREALLALAPDKSDEEVATHLSTLVRRELIRPDASAGELYQFRHILIRDAAYDSLPKEERGWLHERFARWLEPRVRGQASDYEEILGYHFEQGFIYLKEVGDQRPELAEAAAGFLASAGKRAFDRGDVAAAASILERAASLATGRRRLLLLLEAAEANEHVGRFEKVDSIIEHVRQTAPGDEVLMAIAQIQSLAVLRGGGSSGMLAGLPALEEAIETLERCGEVSAAARGWLLLSDVLGYCGRQEAAREANLMARRRADEAGERGLLLNAISAWLYDGFWEDTSVDEGLAYLEEVEPLTGESLRLERSLNRARAGYLALAGRFDEALAAMEHARGIDDMVRAPFYSAVAAQVDGSIVLRRIDPDAAIEMMQEAYVDLCRMGESGGAATVAGDLASMLLERGEVERASALAEEGLAMSEPDDFDALAIGTIVRARILARNGDRDAMDLVVRALNLVEPTAYLHRKAMVHEYAAEVAHLLGDRDQARDLLAQSLDLYERKGDLWSVQRVRRERPELLT